MVLREMKTRRMMARRLDRLRVHASQLAGVGFWKCAIPGRQNWRFGGCALDRRRGTSLCDALADQVHQLLGITSISLMVPTCG